MTYLVVQKKHGSVTFVKKFRDHQGDVKEKYMFSVGVMTKEEFIVYREIVHALPIEQREAYVRKRFVNDLPTKSMKKVVEKPKAIKPQTTVKKTRKAPTKRIKKDVRKHYPVPSMEYKGRDRGKAHTQIMMEREEKRRIEHLMRHPQEEKKIPQQEPISKFTPEGKAFAARSKRMLIVERVMRKRSK
jgi:hypothetical protein